VYVNLYLNGEVVNGSPVDGINVMNIIKYKGVVAESCPCLIQGILNWLDKNDHFVSLTKTSSWGELKKFIDENDSVILVTSAKWITHSIGIPLFLEYCSKNQVKVLCIVDKDTTKNIVELYNCGIQCLIAMNDSQEEFLWGFKELVNGKRHISSELLSSFLELRVSLKTNNLHHISLTKREEEILSLVSKGHTNKEIALKLFISKRTVDGYRESILDKFGARNTAQLMTMLTDGHDSM
jgi:DNA-binding NarL/FixJ family response regulator